jgi:hypothetical protein
MCVGWLCKWSKTLFTILPQTKTYFLFFSKFKLYSLDGQSFVYKCDYTKCLKVC